MKCRPLKLSALGKATKCPECGKQGVKQEYKDSRMPISYVHKIGRDNIIGAINILESCVVRKPETRSE